MYGFEQWLKSHFFGKYRATVIDNNDPAQKGRLQINVPALLGTLNLWAMPCVPYAGPQVGFYCLPPVGAGVWVEFEGGDPSYPIWVGCFWADGELPPEATAPESRQWQTEQGLLKVDDSSGEIVLENQSQVSITLSDEAKTEAGQASHTVSADGVTSESGAGGKLEVSGLTVSVNNGTFEVG